MISLTENCRSEKKVRKIKLYVCGSCVNDLGIVFQGHQKEKRKFPAMVAYIEHEKLGKILYDTGYSDAIYKNGIMSFLYNLLNKATIPKAQVITNRLVKDGVNPNDIHFVILSHAHPDHMGALPLLRNYKLIATKEVLRTMKNPKLLDLVFRNMQPGKGVKKYALREYEGDYFLKDYFSKVYDICGDGSMMGVALDGHAKGQLGIYFPEYQLLLASDACWGKDLIQLVPKMKRVPRLIQNNYREYQDTAKALSLFRQQHPEIDIVFSHQVGGFPDITGE